MKQIFLVEDDSTIARNLSLLLRAEGYEVMCVSTRSAAAERLSEHRFDLALVDISLPDGNGFAVCTEIKERQDIPVIFLTASDDEASVVTGLNMGADDYVTKPFRPRELVARIKAALRKGGKASSSFNIGGLLVDTASGIVKKNGSEIFLSALEYRLLLVFVSNPKSIITRDRLLNELWDAAGEFVTDNALTVYIKRLREKIEDDPAAPRIIRTVRGTGYRLGEGDVSESGNKAVCGSVLCNRRRNRNRVISDSSGGRNPLRFFLLLARTSFFHAYKGEIRENCGDLGGDRPGAP